MNFEHGHFSKHRGLTFFFYSLFLFMPSLVFEWSCSACRSVLLLFMSQKMRCPNRFTFAGWKSLCCETGMAPQESVLMSEECDKRKTVSALLSLLISGIALLIIWHDIKEGSAWADNEQCSTSSTTLHRTY